MKYKTKEWFSAALCAILCAGTAKAEVVDDLFSQHLDSERLPRVYAGAYLPETEFGNHGSTDIIEASLDWEGTLLEEFFWGTLDLGISGRAMYFVDEPGIDALPDALLAAWLEPAYTLRFMNGWSFRVAARPGIYSDVVAPAFGCPASLDFYFAACPELSFVIGGEWRAGWDFEFIPHAGLIWEPVEELRFELGCPDTRIELFPRHILSFFAKGQWLNTTYKLDRSDKEDKWKPEDVTFDEIRVSAGASLRIFGLWYVSAEAGTWLERELSADVKGENAMDLSKDNFFRVTLSGAF